METTRICIVDPGLVDIRGHHFGLALNLTKGCLSAGYSVVWVTNARFNKKAFIIDEVKIPVYSVINKSAYGENYFCKILVGSEKIIVKVKTYLIKILVSTCKLFIKKFYKKTYKKIYGYKPNVKKLNISIERLLGVKEIEPYAGYKILSKQINKIIKSEKLSNNDHVLIHTADSNSYWMIFDLLLNRFKQPVPYFHLCTPYTDDYMPHISENKPVKHVISYLNLLGYLDKKIYLYAENALLQKHLSFKWGQRVNTLDLPNTGQNLTHVWEGNDKLNIVFLGAARKEKGFLQLPKVIEEIYKSEKFSCKVKFTIQCSRPIAGYDNDVVECIDLLRSYDNNYVRLIEESLSAQSYYRELKKADVVLLCYQQDRYEFRGSGIAVESVEAAKIIIATEGTFPAYIASEPELEVNSIEDIVNSIKYVVEHYNSLYRKSLVRSREYVKGNTPMNYVKKLIDNTKIVDNSKLSIANHNLFCSIEQLAIQKAGYTRQKYDLPILID